MFKRFTSQSRSAVVSAQEEARSLDHDYIGPEHFLLGLLRADRGGAVHALASAGLTLEAGRQDVEALTGRGERPPSGHIPFTRSAKKCLELSLREALQLGHNYIGTGHLLLGVISEGDNVAVKVLGRRLGADLGDFRARVILDLEDHPEDHDDIPYAARPVPAGLRHVPAPSQRAIAALLDTIDERLSAIERQLGMTRGQAGTGAGREVGREAGDGENSGPENVVPLS
jgi:ATP-dependent Clp protease ATP-binding subunit ClpA